MRVASWPSCTPRGLPARSWLVLGALAAPWGVRAQSSLPVPGPSVSAAARRPSPSGPPVSEAPVSGFRVQCAAEVRQGPEPEARAAQALVDAWMPPIPVSSTGPWVTVSDTLWALFGPPAGGVGLLRGAEPRQLAVYDAPTDCVALAPRLLARRAWRDQQQAQQQTVGGGTEERATPARVSDWTPDGLEWVLVHELAHRLLAHLGAGVTPSFLAAAPVVNPAHYGFAQPAEQMAEGAARAVAFLQRTAGVGAGGPVAPEVLLAAQDEVDRQERQVPGTASWIGALLTSPVYRRHPLASGVLPRPVTFAWPVAPGASLPEVTPTERQQQLAAARVPRAEALELLDLPDTLGPGERATHLRAAQARVPAVADWLVLELLRLPLTALHAAAPDRGGQAAPGVVAVERAWARARSWLDVPDVADAQARLVRRLEADLVIEAGDP